MDFDRLNINKKNRILITGCAGFIGSNLLEFFLGKGLCVRGFDNLSTGFEKNISDALKKVSESNNNANFEFVKGDIRDYESCLEVTRNIDIIFHQAALGSVQRSIENPRDSNSTNIDGTLNLLNSSLKNNVKKFIYASSSSVYGDSPTLPKNEEMPPNPKSIYAVTKLTAEYYCRLYYSLYKLKTISLRYFNVFGKRQDPNSIYSAVIPRFINSIANGKNPVIYGDGKQSRDFTYINNIIYANYLAALSDNKNTYGNYYNIACNDNISLNDIIFLLSKYFKRKTKPVNRAVRKGDIKHSLASIEKAAEDLLYAPVVKFKEGLLELLSKSIY